MRMYSDAPSSTAPSGVPIHTRKVCDMMRPNAPTSTPITRLRATEVCTVSCTSRYLPAPVNCATSTLVPTDRPMKRLTISVISDDVAVTEATAAGFSNLPTTMTSAMLYKSCSMPERISGME